MELELNRSRAVSLAHQALYTAPVMDPKDQGTVRRLADVLQQVHREALAGVSDDYYRLNSLENLLSTGTVILSVGRESECGPRVVFIEPMNRPDVSAPGCLRNALDVLRTKKL
jgi:hypothetical protein